MNLNRVIFCTQKGTPSSSITYMLIAGVALGFVIGYSCSPYLLPKAFSLSCSGHSRPRQAIDAGHNVIKPTEKLSSKNMILISIVSMENDMEPLIEATLNTWAKRSNVKIEIFTKNSGKFNNDQQHSAKSSMKTGINYIQLPELMESNFSLQKKAYFVMKYIRDKYLNTFSWFIFLKDNVYLDVIKLKSILSRINASKLIYLESAKSINEDGTQKDRGHCVGGDGVILSQQLFLEIMTDVESLTSASKDSKSNPCSTASSDDMWALDFTKFFLNRPEESKSKSITTKSQVAFDKEITCQASETPEHQYRFHITQLKQKIKKLIFDVTQIEKEIRQNIETKESRLDLVGHDGQVQHPRQLLHLMKGSNSRPDLQWKTILHPFLFKPDEGWEIKTKIHRTMRTAFTESLKKYLRQETFVDKNNLKLYRSIALVSSYYVLNPIFSVDAISKITSMHHSVNLNSGLKKQTTKTLVTETKYIYQRQLFPTSMQFFLELTEINVDHIKSGGLEKFKIQNKVTVNFLVALSGRPSNFVRFLNNFEVTFLARNEKVNLIVVFFPKASNLTEAGNDASFISQQMAWMAKRFPESLIKLVLQKTGTEFSRGVGLQIASTQVKSPDEIIFFCDVDLIFEFSIATHIRRNTVQGKRVYYPVFFSQYDPDIVYANRPKPNTHFQFGIDDGFWRYFSFGMLSIYKSDFLRTKGFNTNIHGWGLEDVEMFAAVAEANLDVFQSSEPAEVHIYHDKYCDPGTTKAQYKNCLGSRASHFGSKSYMYRLYQTKAEKMRKEAELKRRNS